MTTTTTTPATETKAPKARKAKAKQAADTATQPAAAPVAETTAPATPALAHVAPATPKAPKVPGVAANSKTRAYFAGQVIRKHGHAAGVTPEMVQEVNAAYGDANDIESSICLRNAWHVIRAFTEEVK